MDIKNELNSINKMAQKEYDEYYNSISNIEKIIAQDKRFIKWGGTSDLWPKEALSGLNESSYNSLSEIIYYLSLGIVIGIFSLFVMIAPYIPLPAILTTIIAVILFLFLICGWLYLLLFASINRLGIIEDKIIMFFIKRKAKKSKKTFDDIVNYYFDKDLKKREVSEALFKIITSSKLFNKNDKKHLIKESQIELTKIINITSSIENYEYFKSTYKIKENLIVQNNEK